jgi:predicted RNase H-like HicB family nuclease
MMPGDLPRLSTLTIYSSKMPWYSNYMKHIIQFSIGKEGEYYTAQGIGFPVVTQAKTLDELSENIREATNLAFEGEDFETFGFAKHPSLLMNIELPDSVHA